jgi:hypothetical protein
MRRSGNERKTRGEETRRGAAILGTGQLRCAALLTLPKRIAIAIAIATPTPRTTPALSPHAHSVLLRGIIRLCSGWRRREAMAGDPAPSPARGVDRSEALLLVGSLAVAALLGWALLGWTRRRRNLPPTVSCTVPFVGGLLKFVQGPIPLLRQQYKVLGSVFTVKILTRHITFLLGPEVSAHFFKAQEADLSQREVSCAQCRKLPPTLVVSLELLWCLFVVFCGFDGITRCEVISLIVDWFIRFINSMCRRLDRGWCSMLITRCAWSSSGFSRRRSR